MAQPFSYEIIYSSRKSLAVQITVEGAVKVRAPRGYPAASIEAFLKEKEPWILKHIDRARQNCPKSPPPLSDYDRNRYIQTARSVFTQKTAYYAAIMGVTYGRISIREQKTRWGSCSSKGDLNFNWRLIFAPGDVLDYIVVHELAHRREMNHSSAFYAIVGSILPDYKKQQKWLRDNGHSLWTIV